MLPESLKELLGLGDLGLKDYELIEKLQEGRRKRLEEIEFVGKDSRGRRKIIKIKLKQLNPEGIIDHDVWGW